MNFALSYPPLTERLKHKIDDYPIYLQKVLLLFQLR